MPEIVPNVTRNMKDRLLNIKSGVVDEVSVFKEVWGDLKGRLGRTVTEPTMGKKYGLPAGITGGLAGTIAAISVATMDVVEKHVQESGKITRRWIG